MFGFDPFHTPVVLCVDCQHPSDQRILAHVSFLAALEVAVAGSAYTGISKRLPA